MSEVGVMVSALINAQSVLSTWCFGKCVCLRGPEGIHEVCMCACVSVAWCWGEVRSCVRPRGVTTHYHALIRRESSVPVGPPSIRPSVHPQHPTSFSLALLPCRFSRGGMGGSTQMDEDCWLWQMGLSQSQSQSSGSHVIVCTFDK